VLNIKPTATKHVTRQQQQEMRLSYQTRSTDSGSQELEEAVVYQKAVGTEMYRKLRVQIDPGS
jgi:hypothetical protein